MVGSHKKALVSLWKDRFSIVEYQETTKENQAIDFEEVTVLENQKCRLSFSSLKEAVQNDVNAAVIQVVKVFCEKELIIKPGSKLKITGRNGHILEYSQSGEPGIFSHHQEIVLVPFKGWA